MAGVKGQRSKKPKRVRMLPHKYRRDWLHALDRRSAIFHAISARLADLTQDLGGADALSYQQRSLCKRAIWIESRLMAIEEEMIVDGNDEAMGTYGYLTNILMGIYKTLGIHRQARSIGKLRDYIEAAK